MEHDAAQDVWVGFRMSDLSFPVSAPGAERKSEVVFTLRFNVYYPPFDKLKAAFWKRGEGQ
jgi:hypothetical protein